MESSGQSPEGTVVLNCAPVIDVVVYEPMAVDIRGETTMPSLCSSKSLKRKRSSQGVEDAEIKDRCALVASCRHELGCLLELYKEMSNRMIQVEMGANMSQNSMVGCLMEESSLPFSKLVEEIYQKLKDREGSTLASIRSSVLCVGQRVMYGTSNAEADVLEDESEDSLWCWETRDLKNFPVNVRGLLQIRRTARKKIQERINAISETLAALETNGDHENQKMNLKRAIKKLRRALNFEGIQLLVGNRRQKLSVEMDNKALKVREKETIKGVQNKMNTKTGSLKIAGMLQNDIVLHEANAEVAHGDQNNEPHCENEVEAKKQQKRQQEEIREQKRREKEVVELKRKLSIQKQADMMQRFLKCSKTNENSVGPENSMSMAEKIGESCSKTVESTTVTSLMDSCFQEQRNCNIEDLWRSHLTLWHKSSGHKKSSRWGVRRMPKDTAFKELTLLKVSNDGSGKISQQSNHCFPEVSECELPGERITDVLDMRIVRKEYGNSTLAQPVKRKLLQFDKSNRPAYYGTWSKKSSIIRPRQPYQQDPNLDYEVDSDEEWEEEEPGEDLSDCDKDGDEILEEDCKVEGDDESEDSFVVPDGYLSDNEGVCTDGALGDENEEVSSFSYKNGAEAESCLRQQKVLDNLTEQGLRRGQPLVICNLNHQKTAILMAEGLDGPAKFEQLCLQALCMRPWCATAIVNLSIHDIPSSPEAQGTSNSENKSGGHVVTPTISDADLPEIVMTIQACPHGINKLVEELHRKFPDLAKAQLRNKVREVSDFVDNRWQVKKDILEKIGLCTTPPEKSQRSKGIALYFSKRCLPPQEQIQGDTLESSPQPYSKLRNK